MARVSLEVVTRRFGRDAPAVDAITLDIREREFLALLGPSGCGKTTLLRLIAGFERPDSGAVAIDGETVANDHVFVPPERRRVGMVFQSYALWPHMDVRRNVGYALEVAGIRGAAYERAVQEALAAVGLGGFETRKPATLSGGQRQRVALARCLAMAPKLVLLDEPLANLDVHLRASLQAEFARIHATLGATMIYVTHDQAEALALADRVAVMDQGRILQVATPRELYRRPLSATVAAFLGRGRVLPCTVRRRLDAERVEVELFGRLWPVAAAPEQQPGSAAICLRPEDLALAADGVAARAGRHAFLGAVAELEVSIGGETLRAQIDPDAAPAPGAAITVALRGGWVIPESDRRSAR